MRITIIGYGKMGKTIEKLAKKAGHDVVMTISGQNKNELSKENLQRCDVAIEFSQPDAAFENISICLKAGIPVVSGTTGWLDRLEEVKSLCNSSGTALLYASNFSIGVNIFFAVNRHLAAMMDDQRGYRVEMEEIHHTEKRDYPSGTAITLAEGILKNLKRKTGWQADLAGSESGKKSAGEEEIPILSRRIDRIPGTHLIKWTSGIDTIEISHTAHSREGFAAGALTAAEWIIGKKGYFEMKDMLGF